MGSDGPVQTCPSESQPPQTKANSLERLAIVPLGYEFIMRKKKKLGHPGGFYRKKGSITYLFWLILVLVNLKIFLAFKNQSKGTKRYVVLLITLYLIR